MPKPKQKGIRSFLKVQETRDKQCVTVTEDGMKRLCDICGRSFYAQGWVQHRRSHSEDAKLYKMPHTGKVKIRGELYSKKGTPGK